jgi:hypothetical protein
MKSVAIIGLMLLFAGQLGFAQIGGTSTYKALSLPSSPRISALGGSALGIFDDDINLALDNPAFNQPGIHRQLSFSNNFYFANINYGTLAYAHHFDKIGTFNFSMKYIAYGEMEGRDEAGNFVGYFRAGDYVVNAGYGSAYKEKWLYGANVKLIYSHLETYNSVGIAMDLSGAYHNEEKQFTFSAILKNVGFQIKAYTDEGREPIPLEFSLGLSKKFSNIPVRLNLIVHNLQQPDIAYFNPDLAGNTNIFGESESNKPSIVDQIFRHFIFGAEIDIAKPLSIRFGYNHLVRQEASLPSKKGIAGITMGAGVHIKQFSMDYAFAKYHAAANIHHLGLTVNLEEFLGKKSKTIENEN